MKDKVFLPHAYVINLDRDINRLHSITRNLEAAGLSFIRIPAVVGKEIANLEQYINHSLYYKRNRRLFPKPGEVGCYLSHLKAMSTFLESPDPWCIILEDDAELLPDCKKVLRLLSENTRWDIVKLFNFHSGMPIKKHALGDDYHLVIYLTRTTSCAAYAINRQAAQKILDQALPMSEQIDHAIDRPWETGLRIFGIRPMLATLSNTSLISTIGYEKEPSEHSISRSTILFLTRASKEVWRFCHSLITSCCK
jgi:glycosyl transferase family 25